MASFRNCDRARSRHPAQQMVTDADRVGHGGERGVHGPDAREETRVDDVQVVDLVRFAVPDGVKVRASVPPPAPLPTMVTSWHSVTWPNMAVWDARHITPAG